MTSIGPYIPYTHSRILRKQPCQSPAGLLFNRLEAFFYKCLISRFINFNQASLTSHLFRAIQPKVNCHIINTNAFGKKNSRYQSCRSQQNTSNSTSCHT